MLMFSASVKTDILFHPFLTCVFGFENVFLKKEKKKNYSLDKFCMWRNFKQNTPAVSVVDAKQWLDSLFIGKGSSKQSVISSTVLQMKQKTISLSKPAVGPSESLSTMLFKNCRQARYIDLYSVYICLG